MPFNIGMARCYVYLVSSSLRTELKIRDSMASDHFSVQAF